MTMVLCAGCEEPIIDRYLFHVLDKAWHAACISCSDCKALLVDRCFSRNGLLYCKEDFFRRFGTKCAGCEGLVAKEDLIRRARDKVFHINCFCCSVCHKQLDTGEELYIVNGNKFICKEDYVVHRSTTLNTPSSDCGSEELGDEEDCGDEMKSESEFSLNLTELSGGGEGGAGAGEGGKGKTKASSKGGGDENAAVTGGGGTKRRGPRTTIKAKQLETLKAAFAATPKPTRHIREQLAQETGLNMRVIQVWFQNRRSKERRMKQLRYGGYRPGRRSRGNRDDPMVPPHMYTDGIGRDPYYQHPMGDPYFMMVGGDGPLPPPHEMALPPHHPFPPLMPPEESVTNLDAHPQEGHFMMDERVLRRGPGGSPEMGEDAFHHEQALLARQNHGQGDPGVMNGGTW